jgi:CubicO group peptidase (beta-lactamase class C family)
VAVRWGYGELAMRLSTAALALCFLFLPAAAYAQEKAPSPASAASEAALADFDAYMAETIRQWDVPGVAVSIVKDGRIVLAKGYGVRDPVTGQPMTKDTIFTIASSTKPFTTFSAGLLVDEGKINFDAPVSTYLKGFAMRDPAATAGLTLRDMFSHRSGLASHAAVYWHNYALTREELLARLAYLDSSQPLRAKFQYNNIMYMLAGLVVQRVAGTEWETFTTQRIFQPLEMDRTFFGYERALADPNHIGGREMLDGKQVNVPLLRNMTIRNPTGGIYTNAEDLANWMLVHLDEGRFKNRQIIQPATLADLHRTHMPTGATARDSEYVPVGYGMGWFIDIYRGRQFVHHGGNLPGVSTMVALLPSERLGVTVLVNQGESGLRDALTRSIIDRFLGATGKDWLGEGLARQRAREASQTTAGESRGGSRVEGTQPSQKLGNYAGTYRHPGYSPLTVELKNGRLVGLYNNDISTFSHRHYDVFVADTRDLESNWLDAQIQFVSDLDGRVSGVRIPFEPSLPPILFERQPDPKLTDPAYLRRLTGTYDFRGRKATVALAGKRLSLSIAGGAPAALLPSLGGEYVHEQRRDSQIGFRIDTGGRVAAMLIADSTGVYEAKRLD